MPLPHRAGSNLHRRGETRRAAFGSRGIALRGAGGTDPIASAPGFYGTGTDPIASAQGFYGDSGHPAQIKAPGGSRGIANLQTQIPSLPLRAFMGTAGTPPQ